MGAAVREYAEANGLDFSAAGRVRAATHALAAAGVEGERAVASGELRPGLQGQLFTVSATADSTLSRQRLNHLTTLLKKYPGLMFLLTW
jgi:hypothetical protein